MQKQFSKENTAIVKGLAIILLLLYHLFENEYETIMLGVDFRPFSLESMLKLVEFGNICVSVFVFLTAFGISKGILLQENISVENVYSQATKRFFTLMFHFVCAYVSANLFWWYRFDYPGTYGIGKQGFLNICLDATGLVNFFGGNTMNVTWWYMKIAYILIFLIPLLALGIRKIGYPIVALSFMVTFLVQIDSDIERYLFTAVLGVCAAYGNWMDKLLNLKCPRIVQWMVGILGVMLCVSARQNREVQENYLYIVDAFVVLFLVYFAGALLASVPVVKNILGFLGKHSMNIYLVHTFFYLLLWREFIYSFRYAGVILVVLIVVCLMYSIVLESVKALLQKICKRLVICREPKAPR
uniref:acyltransferase family protein n=1 Tax=Acetatifactor sp. TaxID=1872090 RepID=UPI0040569137